VLRTSVAIGVAALLCGILRAASGQSPEAAERQRLLAGTIDVHVHAHPDNVPRSVDGLEAASQAHAHAMRGIILKNHYEPTAGLAYLARKAAPGLEVFGGIDLNLTVGGMNPAAVEHLTRIAGGWGRVVWMSTFDAENQVRYSKEARPFVSVSRNGELLPETRAVIGVIARHDLVLATGHVSSAEALLLLREGQRQGVRHMIVTHAINAPILMDLAQMRDAAQLGAFIEFAGSTLAPANAAARIDRYAEVIRAVGADSCILSSDLGQQGNPLPADGYGDYLMAMRARGFTDQELAVMTKHNPARLLGLR
jgi:hypothetical protein